ncbi:hypothetical protein ACFL06_00760 [Patescibacteria group bacterium]
MNKKEKEKLFNLFMDKMHELEMLFPTEDKEMYSPESYDKAIFDKKSGRYLNLEDFVRKEISDKEIKRRKEARIRVRRMMEKEFGKLGIDKPPKWSSDIKHHQMLHSFYQNEFIPEISRIKNIRK